MTGADDHLVRWRLPGPGQEMNDGVKTQSSDAAITVDDYGRWVVRVEACNAGGCGPGVSKAALLRQARPGQPQNLVVSVSPGELDLTASWDAVEGAASYRIGWRRPTGNFAAGNQLTTDDTRADITVADYGQWVVRDARVYSFTLQEQSDVTTTLESDTDPYVLLLDRDGIVERWGSDEHGQASPPPDTTFVSITSGSNYTCGLLSDDTQERWGRFEPVERSAPTPTPQPTPEPTPAPPEFLTLRELHDIKTTWAGPDRIAKVYGYVAVIEDVDGVLTLRIRDAGYEDCCEFDEAHRPAVTALSEGDQVTVDGAFNGARLRDCVVVSSVAQSGGASLTPLNAAQIEEL